MPPGPEKHELTRVAASANSLAFALYRALSTRDNLVFSPLGIHCLLGMLYEGARGETREALARLVHLDARSPIAPLLKLLLDELEMRTGLPPGAVQSDEDRAAFIRDLKERGVWDEEMASDFGTASAEDLRLDLAIANGIWIQNGYPCKPDFLAAVNGTLGAETTTLDLTGNPAKSCDVINTWVGEKTHGRIGPVLSPDMLDPLTRAVLANALYFKARWQDQFGEPEPGPFYLLDGTRVEAQMMGGRIFSHNYFQGRDFWAVELPYYGSYISMVLIVPSRAGLHALVDLEQKLQGVWDSLRSGNQMLSAYLTMPQFTIRGFYDLSSGLGGLGLDKMFGDQADFSGISAEPGFHVDTALQGTYIAVDQYGTEAAAATLATVLGASMVPPKVLTVDRPFLFAIVDTASTALLFLGKVENPS